MDLSTTPGYVPGFAAELNLRELGGLPTTDGRLVRRGLFYRGSALVDLSEAEQELIDAMDLRFMLDLRAAGEATPAPDYVPAGCERVRIGGMRTADGSEVDFSPEAIAKLEREFSGGFDDGSFMRGLYVRMAFGNPASHALMERLVAGEAPLYFHCTAGKDRTGVCAMLVGLALGVTREAIIEDFLLTNEYRRSIIETVADRMPAGTPAEVIERWQRANGVQIEDLQAVLDAIDERHGTAEAYLKAEFGIGAHALHDLRDRFTV